MVMVVECLAKMKEAQAMKIPIDAALQKEAVIKECLQPWINEALVVSTTIERKVAHMQEEYAPIEEATVEGDV